MHSKITIEKVDLESDPNFLIATVSVDKNAGRDVINMDLKVLQDVFDISFVFVFSMKQGDAFVQIQRTEPADPCNPGSITDPMILMQMGQLEKYGNMTEFCPLPKGVYGIRNLGMDDCEDGGEPDEHEGTYRVEMYLFNLVGGAQNQLLKKVLYITYVK